MTHEPTWIPRRSPALTSPQQLARRACNLVAPRGNNGLADATDRDGTESIMAKQTERMTETNVCDGDPRDNQGDHRDSMHQEWNANAEDVDEMRAKRLQDIGHLVIMCLPRAFKETTKGKEALARPRPLFSATPRRPLPLHAHPAEGPARANTPAGRSS
jgi:hypothetical protein